MGFFKYSIHLLLIAFTSISYANPVDHIIDTLTEFGLEAAWPWSASRDKLYLSTSSGLLVANNDMTEKYYNNVDLFPIVTDTQHLYLTSRTGRLWQSPIRAPGEVNWQREFQDWVFPPVVKNDRLYITTRFAGLQAVDTGTGETLWTAALDHEPVYRPILFPNDQVAVLTFGSMLLIYSNSGALQYQIKLPAIGKYLVTDEVAVGSEPTMIYIVGIDGSLMYFNWKSGQIRHQKVARRVLTPVLLDHHMWWLLDDKSIFWQLNLVSGALTKRIIDQHNLVYLFADGQVWTSIISTKGVVSKQWPLVTPAITDRLSGD